MEIVEFIRENPENKIKRGNSLIFIGRGINEKEVAGCRQTKYTYPRFGFLSCGSGRLGRLILPLG